MALQVQIQVYQNGQMTGQMLLDGSKKVNKIGKTATSQIKIDDPAASRVHAVVEVSRTGVWLIDMGSSVGTKVNGVRINKTKLKNGDQIAIGSTTLLVTMGSDLDAMSVGMPPLGGVTTPQPPPQVTPPMQAPPQMTQVTPQMRTPPPKPQTVSSLPRVAPPLPQAVPMPSPNVPPQGGQAPMWHPPAGSGAPLWNASSQPTPVWNVPGQNSTPQWGSPAPVMVPPSQPLSSTPFGASTENGPVSRTAGNGTFHGMPFSDSQLDRDDPTLLRMQASSRRNRLIGGVVIVGIVAATAAFVWLGTLGEAPTVEEASNYSTPVGGMQKSPKGEGENQADVAGEEPKQADKGEGENNAVQADSGEGKSGKTDDGEVEDTTERADEGEDAGEATESDKGSDKSALAAFDSGEERDNTRFLYRTLSGEQTLDAVATEHYGDASRVALLSEANPLLPEDAVSINAGTEVRVPRYGSYEVKPGDTLGGIAAAELGTAKRYEEIFEANKDVLASPTAIEVGMRLKIPLLKE